MAEKKIFGNVKITVLIGFLILITLSIFGLISIYRQLVEFTETTTPHKVQSRELNLVSNALLSMYEAESTRKVMLSETMFTPSLKTTLVNANKNVRSRIDSLYAISTDTKMTGSLDTVNFLLDNKQQNLIGIYQLIDSINNLPYSNIISTTVLSKKQVADLKKMIAEKMITTKDTSFYIKKKRSFGERLKAVFTASSDSVKVVSKKNVEVSDTGYLVPTQILTDTIVQYFNNVNARSNKRKIIFISKLASRQNQMLYYDQLLTEQINRILKRIEKNERATLRERILKKENVQKKSYQLVSKIAFLAIFFAIFFIVWSFILINNSQKNRKKLEESKRFAEELVKSRERLMLMISHDIKAPLSSIIGHVELMYDEELTEKNRRNLDNICYSSEQILELAKKMLDYHQLEQGKSEVQLISINPYQMVQDIIESYKLSVQKKGLYLKINNKIPKETYFQCAPNLIKQILNNLISNAIKFTHEGGVKVTSFIQNENKELVVSIKDTGIGILEEDKENIFKYFGRGIRAGEYMYDVEGHGLGLAITDRLVKLLGGTIQFESKKNVGTEFQVVIPIAETVEEQRGNNEPINSSNLHYNIEGVQVLFVDDDVPMLNVYSSLVSKYGATVHTFYQPREVIDFLKENRVDIVFTDIQMPEINGFQLVKKIRNINNYYSNIPVIALSARSEMKKKDYMEAGFTQFLIKPISFQTLLTLIDATRKTNQNVKVQTLQNNTLKGISGLIEYVKDDKATSLEILNTFKLENERKIDEIRKAIVKEDWENIQSNAHKLLPLMRMIGADDIVLLAEKLEAGEKDSLVVGKLLTKIEDKNTEIERFIIGQFSQDC